MARRKRVSNSKTPSRRAAKSKGFASAFEYEVAQQIKDAGGEYEYERESYEWMEKIPRAVCGDCGGAAYARRSYTPDFFLPNGRIIEVKGRFTVKDRKIAVAMKEAGVVICYLFGFDNKLNRTSKTRYTDWCAQQGLECAVKEIPKEWLT